MEEMEEMEEEMEEEVTEEAEDRMLEGTEEELDDVAKEIVVETKENVCTKKPSRPLSRSLHQHRRRSSSRKQRTAGFFPSQGARKCTSRATAMPRSSPLPQAGQSTPRSWTTR